MKVVVWNRLRRFVRRVEQSGIYSQYRLERQAREMAELRARINDMRARAGLA